jgi:hypothetical protein
MHLSITLLAEVLVTLIPLLVLVFLLPEAHVTVLPVPAAPTRLLIPLLPATTTAVSAAVAFPAATPITTSVGSPFIAFAPVPLVSTHLAGLLTCTVKSEGTCRASSAAIPIFMPAISTPGRQPFQGLRAGPSDTIHRTRCNTSHAWLFSDLCFLPCLPSALCSLVSDVCL